MPKARELNKLLVDDDKFEYKIVVTVPGKGEQTETVTADEIAYGAVGIRLTGKTVILDHIRSGRMIAEFHKYKHARAAVRELFQITDFKWVSPPSKAVSTEVVEIIKRWKEAA